MSMSNKGLEARTLNYWTVSRIWQGQSNRAMTTEKGLAMLNVTAQFTPPDKRLYFLVCSLSAEIVEGKAIVQAEGAV